MMDRGRDLPDQGSWDQFWSRDSSKRFGTVSWAKNRIKAVLLAQTPFQGPVLDAGCGSGFFSAMFQAQGLEVVALDYAPEALVMTRQLTQGRVETVQADLVRDRLVEKFPTKKFKLIFSDGLLEHFAPADQKRILENFCSVLDQDGVVVSFVPNRWSPWQIVRPMFMPGIQEQPFVLSALRRLHEDSRLRVLHDGGVNVLPFCFSPEILGRAFGMLLYVVAKKAAFDG